MINNGILLEHGERHGGGGTGGGWWKCYWNVMRGDVEGKRMDALGDIAVAVLVVTSGNIIMRHTIGEHLEGCVGDWLEEAWMNVLEINCKRLERTH